MYIKNIINGNFLIKNFDSSSKWNLILFLVILAFIIITSSHIMDNRIIYINKLYEEIKELEIEYTNINIQLMNLKSSSKSDILFI